MPYETSASGLWSASYADRSATFFGLAPGRIDQSAVLAPLVVANRTVPPSSETAPTSVPFLAAKTTSGLAPGATAVSRPAKFWAT